MVTAPAAAPRERVLSTPAAVASSMQINREHHSPNYNERPVGVRPSCIVVHATAGTNSLPWLTDPKTGVSAHYLIRKDGLIYALVPEERRAWHAGKSEWQGRRDVNDFSLGLELENRNTGADPYPPAQWAAAVELCRDIMARWGIAPADVVSHAQVAPGRKHDPAAPAWNMVNFRAAVFPSPAPPASPPYSADSPLLGTPRATAAQAVAYVLARPHGEYTEHDVRAIVAAYWQQATAVSLDPVLCVAQVIHETGALSSWWSQRPQRNPAGIGVTGAHSAEYTEGYIYNTDRGRWEAGVSYRSWRNHAIPAHVGRLVGYALHPDRMNEAQRTLYRAVTVQRPLPARALGAAPTLRGLNGIWAVPGHTYASRIAGIANAICEVSA